MTELSQSQKDFIAYSSLAGICISAMCFMQQLYIINGDFTIAILFSLSALLSLLAFTALVLKKKISGVLLIIAASLLFIRQAVIVFMAVKMGIVMFSLLQIILFVYCIVMAILVQVNGYPALFGKIEAEKKLDQEYWNNV